MASNSPLSPEILVCGTLMRLMALETTKSKWTTYFIGAKPGRYLIVEMPRVAGAPVKLDEGGRWAVTFISKGCAYTFNTAIIGYTYRLVPLLFLEYPDTVEEAVLRNEKRYPVNIPALLHVESMPDGYSSEETPECEPAPAQPGGEPVKAVVADLSEGGIMAVSATPFLIDSIVEASLFLPHGPQITGLKATVKSCRGGREAYSVGMSFHPSTKPDVTKLIDDYIRNIENMALRL